MYQRKSNLQNLIIMLLDCATIATSLILANYLRNGRLFESDDMRMDFGLLLGASLVVFLALNLFGNLYRGMLLRGPLHELFCIVRNNAVLFAGAAVSLYFMGLLDAYSRLVFLYFVLIDCALMLVVHQLWKKLLPSLYRIFKERRRTLLVADDAFAEELAEDMQASKGLSYELIGIALMGDPAGKKQVCGLPVVAGREELVDYCTTASLDEVIVAVSDTQDERTLRLVDTLSQMGVTVHYRISVPELSGAHQKALTQFGRFYTVTYANRFVPTGQLVLKRLMDLAGGLVGFCFLALLTVIVGPVIRLESPGPVFFAQKRVGRNGRIFKMYKFRSMYADAEERKKELMAHNEMSGLMFKMENDPRITRVGAFLRRTSLDEFPQFVNILKGDMSLVGTRPPTLDEFARYSPYHKKRLSFRPGLTGMWQVSGRSDITDFEEIVRLDVEYIDNWSIWLDIKILLKTVLQVFARKGAR
ncbi:MAG: sugar transferase [Eubacteriales bacterium]|nr:sugar transferase [Eubacteriales bacterium]